MRTQVIAPESWWANPTLSWQQFSETAQREFARMRANTTAKGGLTLKLMPLVEDAPRRRAFAWTARDDDAA